MKLKLIILLALASLLSACESTDEHGVTVSKNSIFGYVSSPDLDNLNS
ncbi:MAG: hypothetical protein R3Y46_01415 [Opitutales bacterium]